MQDKDTIINFLLDRVSELNQENKRLNDVIDQLHIDCYCRDNGLNEKEDKGMREMVFCNGERKIAQSIEEAKKFLYTGKVKEVHSIKDEEELPF